MSSRALDLLAALAFAVGCALFAAPAFAAPPSALSCSFAVEALPGQPKTSEFGLDYGHYEEAKSLVGDDQKTFLPLKVTGNDGMTVDYAAIERFYREVAADRLENIAALRKLSAFAHESLRTFHLELLEQPHANLRIDLELRHFTTPQAPPVKERLAVPKDGAAFRLYGSVARFGARGPVLETFNHLVQVAPRSPKDGKIEIPLGDQGRRANLKYDCRLR